MAIVIPAARKHTASVIIGHGLGDSGLGMAWLAESWLRRNKFQEVSFIFPNAPPIPITMNGGMVMPGWYDITSLSDSSASHDEAGILRSREVYYSLINDEIKKGIPSSRVVVGGFSQGGAMALISGLTSPDKLGGIFGLGSYLPMHAKAKEMIDQVGNKNRDTPIFLGHGDSDDIVRTHWGAMSSDKLKEWGFNVRFNTYRGLRHSIDEKEVTDLEEYLNQVIPPQTKGS